MLWTYVYNFNFFFILQKQAPSILDLSLGILKCPSDAKGERGEVRPEVGMGVQIILVHVQLDMKFLISRL